MLAHSRPTNIRFAFQPPSDPSLTLRVAEITLTYKGVPIPHQGDVGVSSSYGSNNGAKVIDGRADTFWQAADTGVQAATLYELNFYPVDGYRITPTKVADGQDFNPTGWDVYVYRAQEVGWVRVDSQRDVVWPRATVEGKDSHATTNFFFSRELMPGSVFGPETDLAVLGTGAQSLRVTTAEPLVVGHLTAKGSVSLENGSTLSVKSLKDFSGQFVTTADAGYLKQAKVAIRAEGGEEQAVPVTAIATNLAVVNGGTAPVSLLLNDGDRQFGRLADGDFGGKLGVVKRGSGTSCLATEDAGYTGPTRVEEGTLMVVGGGLSVGTVTAKYIRVRPLATYGTLTRGSDFVDQYGFNWAIGYFQLLDEGGNQVNISAASVSAPYGFINNDSIAAMCGDTTKRCLIKNGGDVASALHPVTIYLSTGITFAGYLWCPDLNSPSAVETRNPVELEIAVSDDNENWTVVDVSYFPHSGGDWHTVEKSIVRGPAALSGLRPARAGSILKTLPQSLLADPPNPRQTFAKLKSKIFQFEVFETNNPEASEDSYGWHIAELSLYRDGQRMEWPAGTTITCAGATVNVNNNSRLTNICNNVVWEPSEGGDTTMREGCFVQGYPSYVTITTPEEIAFDAYSFHSSANTVFCRARIPSCWRLRIRSSPSADWYIADAHTDFREGKEYPVITKAYQEIGPFYVGDKFPLLDMGACNVLGDESPVTIAAGATLRIASAYEKMGPISGAGTLVLDWATTAEINACAPATFSGKVEHYGRKGTLAVTGAAVQTFDNVDLSGVATLELNGGALVGTASAGGDLAVQFNGGAYNGTITVPGALSVTGTMKIAVPENVVSGYRRTLFTYESIDDASKEILRSASADNPESLPQGFRMLVTAKETECTVSIAALGTLVIFR